MAHALPLALLLLTALAAGALETLPLVDITDPGINDRATRNAASSEVVETPDGKALEVRYRADTDWPNIRFSAPGAYTVTDWSDWHALALTLSNPSGADVRANVRVDDRPDSRGPADSIQGGFDVPAAETVRIYVPLKTLAIDNMRGQPRNRGLIARDGNWLENRGATIDPSHVVSFQVFLARPTEPATIRLHAIELVRFDDAAWNTDPFVDRFGQFTDEEWPGKLHDENELAERIAAEAADLAAHPAPADRNAWGGWAAGPQLEATGRFRVVEREGKWWFVDPDGRLFWSSGVTGVRPESAGPVQGRERWFTWLPAQGDPLARFFNGNRTVYDFYAANLYRKYGDAWRERFTASGIERLKSWGFNTIGNWSDPAGWQQRQVAYTVPIHYRAPSFNAGHKPFPDVFHPDWEAAVAAQLEAHAEYRGDPWCLGIFIDNELPWERYGSPDYTLPRAVLSAGPELHTKRAAVEQLRAKYETIGRLNDAWGTSLASWDALAQPVELTREQAQQATGDLSVMVTLIAARYFQTCRALMDRLMPGTLYFGPRFSSFNREVVAVAKEHCDAVCFNVYAELPTDAPRNLPALTAELDFPVIIGEYHFGALDRGMFHTGLRGAKDQDERAEKFASYLRTAITEPWCVGAHWFQMRDQPLTGRGDGENYNIGFVTITDTAYPEMRAAARAVNDALYRLRSEAEAGNDG